jgi:hypothetical protein
MERIFTKEECERELAKSQAEMIIWMTFLKEIEKGNFVMVDESGKEPIYRIMKAKKLKH